MLGLIDTREPPPDGELRQPWYVEVVGRMFPWPALILWLFVAGQVLDGWWSVLALWGGILLASWRLLRLLPTDTGGMRDYRQ